MAKDKMDNYPGLGEGLSEREVFARPFHDPTASDLFTVPFEAPEEPQPAFEEVAEAAPAGPPSLVYRMTHSQTVLLSGIVFVVAMLGFSLFRVPQPQSMYAQEEPNQVPVVQQTTVTTAEPNKEPALPSELAAVLAANPDQPMSLGLAESFYTQKSFDAAYRVYHQLHEDILDQEEAADFRDYLILRMALCAKGLGQDEVQARLMARAVQSSSPVIQVVTRYQQCLEALREGQLFNALTAAYQALALSDALDPELPWRALLKRNCRFLICQATTRQALALHDADDDLPEQLWQLEALPDPFQGMDDIQVRSLLAQGRGFYDKAILGPRIQTAGGINQGILFQAVCNGASVDEFLNRFAANAHMDVNWSYDVDAGRERIEASIRKRPVHLLMTDASSHAIVELAAGCARLFAEVDAQGTIQIVDPDPTVCPSLSECSQQWTRQALAQWQRLLWATDQQAYVANAHFALGLLREAMSRPSEAISEYRLLADRYPRSRLAPFALLRTSRIKTNMRDFLGARDNLKLLVDQYPDVDFSDDAVLYLAEATLRGGLYDEAYRLFMKANNQADTNRIRRGAAWGAGQCSYATGRFDKASRWIVTYMDLADTREDIVPEAILLLGKVFRAMGQYDKAIRVFGDLLEGETEKEHYWEALQELVQVRIAQDQPVKATHLLLGNHPWNLSQEQENELMILQAQVYRSMGLMQKATSLLNTQLRLMPDRQQRAQAYHELGLCAIAREDYHGARRWFSEVLVLSEPSRMTLEARVGLARACLALGLEQKTQELCQQVLDIQPPLSVRNQALQLLSEAHLYREEYELAAQHLLDQLPKTEPNAVETAAEDVASNSSEPLVSKNG